MKKTKKIMLTLFVAALTMASLTSCGSKKTNNTETKTEEKSTSSADVITSTEKTSEEVISTNEDSSVVTINISSYNNEIGTVTLNDSDTLSLDIKKNTTVKLSASENSTYKFLGWYSGNTKISSDRVYSFEAKEAIDLVAYWDYFTITYKLNGSTNNENNPSYYQTSTDTNLLDPVLEDGVFEGWYLGDKKITKIDSSLFGNIELEAKFVSANVSTNILNAGTLSYPSLEDINVGDSFTVSQVTNLGYKFLGWYNNDEFVTKESSYLFTLNDKSLNIIAKYEINEELSNFTFTSTETTLNITGLKDNTITEIVVPNYVTEISEGAFNTASNLVSLTIPFVGGKLYSSDTLTTENHYPFGYIFGTESQTYSNSISQKYNLGTATYYIPKTLKNVVITNDDYIQTGAFMNINLDTISLSEDVVKFEKNSFYKFSSTKIYYDGDLNGWIKIDKKTDEVSILNGSYYLYLKDEEGSVSFNEKKYNLLENAVIDSTDSLDTTNLFHGYLGLKSITFSEGITIIDIYACSGCSNLQTINFPSTMLSIKNYAFSRCSSLTNINLNDGLLSIYKEAFINCTGLESLSIPSTVTSIASDAFKNCSSIESIVVDSKNTKYNSNNSCNALI
ncbi:MAG: leucine-rich repeat domain-containing protein, partial [Acholeplasmatales bacterium]|nr:leucine-rich repeat domain-containing protein [Acholeplasmatales bacterium]